MLLNGAKILTPETFLRTLILDCPWPLSILTAKGRAAQAEGDYNLRFTCNLLHAVHVIKDIQFFCSGLQAMFSF